MSQDLCLRQDVERELGWEPMARAAEIGVGIKDGIVTLSGVVDNYEAKRAAERAAARVRGVKAVSSELEVKPARVTDRTGQDIAWSVANVLACHPVVHGDRIRVVVSQGWVTLEGCVDSRSERSAAEDAVAGIAGVGGVTNLISVAAARSEDELQAEVEAALRRCTEVDWRRIVAEARQNCVTLWGSVHSLAEREAAEQAVWSAAGVREVSNHLTVACGVVDGQ
jgi:osmotically-inducible protein OsmY